MTKKSLLALRGLRLSFAPKAAPVLDQLDLEVFDGETLCLLGQSGCGKSTLLRIIAGLEQPSAGGVIWAGGAPPQIGFVFQEPNLMPWADVFANVYLPLRLAGASRQKAAPLVMQALAQVGLPDAAQALPRELSGGMKMRVSLARAIVDRPKLLLLDEPFAALDEITRWQLNDLLLRLRRDTGATIVFVTHSVYEAANLASRIAVMRAKPGKIAALLLLAASGQARRGEAAYALDCAQIGAALELAMQ